MSTPPCERTPRTRRQTSNQVSIPRRAVRRRPHERAVLLIDDDPDRAIPLIAALAAAPRTRFRLRLAETAAEATVRLRHGHTHAVLLDLAVRERAWIGELDLLRADRPDIPIVVVTEPWCRHEGRIAVALGARACILRPDVTPRGLERALGAAIGPVPGDGPPRCPSTGPPEHTRSTPSHEPDDPGGIR